MTGPLLPGALDSSRGRQGSELARERHARATDDDLRRLRELCERGRAAIEDKTYTRELSWQFHAMLAEAAHNGAVDGLAQSFRSTLSLHPVRLKEGARAHAMTVDEHFEILEAIERRDTQAARGWIAAHLLRGTKLERRSADLLDAWRPAPAARRKRAAGKSQAPDCPS